MMIAELNPSLKSLLITHRADPHISKHTDGYYYFTATVPKYDSIILRRSTTINGLAEADEVTIWTKHETGEMGAHIWAPEMHYIHGKWYIYFASAPAEDVWAIRPYVLECSDENPLQGTWVEKGQIKLNFESFSLDATTFEHNGTRYLVWAQSEANVNSNIYIAKMENPWTIEGDQVLLTTPELPWETIGFKVNEGPYILKKNGKLFLTYSASATDYNYCMGLLTADENSNLLDPNSWVKSQKPVLASNEEFEEFGPGHNCFTIAEDGITDILVYHARTYKEIVGDPLDNPDRHTFIKPIKWNDDGTPIFI